MNEMVFITPEFGRFFKAGGIAVMVEELTQGLAKIGEDVIVIAPFYHRNRKGKTDYLKE